ncbi:MAG: hypothetical protein ACU0BO_16180 [Limimaricola soesokkakensis]|uniref:hypothetical protein n=1 Tax=Limimaricola soesokkakensis TaxID=1343159 RepID=UPI0040596067
MADYRDPKVTNADGNKANSMGKWIGIALAALLGLLLLGWLFGLFDPEEAGLETADPALIEETENEAEVETVDPAVTE